MNVEITIPILNEDATLEAQVGKVLSFLVTGALGDHSVSLVIADNGSTDQSPEIAQRLAEANPSVRYVRLEERGVGRALKRSWTTSDADIIGYMDLDLATDLKHLPEAIGAIASDQYDIVTGTRLRKGSRVIGRKPVRAVTSRAFNTMLKSYLGVSFTDGMCGFKFLQRKHLAKLMELGAQSDGWFFATELLVCAEHQKLRLLDLPVEWTDDPNSKANISKLAREYTAAMRDLKNKLATAEAP